MASKKRAPQLVLRLVPHPQRARRAGRAAGVEIHALHPALSLLDVTRLVDRAIEHTLRVAIPVAQGHPRLLDPDDWLTIAAVYELAGYPYHED